MSERGYFAIGVYHGKHEVNIGTLLRSAHNFGAAFVFTVGKRYSHQASDTTKATRHMPLFHFDTFPDLFAHLPFDCQLVGVEQHELALPLPTFHHPERAIYLLGAEDDGLSKDACDKAHQLVEIPGTARCLNVATAGSIVLYDRIAKAREWPRVPMAVEHLTANRPVSGGNVDAHA